MELSLEGCSPGSRLDRETREDGAVAAAVNERFIPVDLEGRGRMDLVEKLEVRGAPSTLVFSPEDEELLRFTGFLAPQEYLQEIPKRG